MIANDMEKYIFPQMKEKLHSRRDEFRKAEMLSGLMDTVFLKSGAGEFSPIALVSRALTEAARLQLKIEEVFKLGYLAIRPELMTDDKKVALYAECIEYLQLVQAGIQSFLETHPVENFVEEAKLDEER